MTKDAYNWRLDDAARELLALAARSLRAFARPAFSSARFSLPCCCR